MGKGMSYAEWEIDWPRTKVVMYTIEGIVTAFIPWSCAFPERVALFWPSTELGLVNMCLYACDYGKTEGKSLSEGCEDEMLTCTRILLRSNPSHMFAGLKARPAYMRRGHCNPLTTSVPVFNPFFTLQAW